MLISIGIGAAFLFTTAVEAFPEFFPLGAQQSFFGTIAALTLFPVLGRWRGERLIEPSGEAAWRLLRRIPASARVVRDGMALMVPCGEVSIGETVRIRPGEQVPLDGEVISGRSRVDESLWTASEVPVEKSPGSRLFGGALNKSGQLEMRVTDSGPATSLANIVKGVREGFLSRHRRPGPADRVCAGYAPAVVIIAAVSSLLWSWLGYEPRLQHAFAAFAFVLIAACPWSIGAIAPAALAAGIRRARSVGIRVRDPGVLRPSPEPDILIIDKTGILTRGRPRLLEIVRLGELEEDSILRLASAAGRRSGHPYSQALLDRTNGGGEPLAVDSAELFPGRGVEAEINGQRVRVGTLPWLAECGISPRADQAERCPVRSEPMLAFSVDGSLEGMLFFTDEPRSGVKEEVRRLAEMGVEVVLASGDREASVRAAARTSGIGRFFFEMGSQEKLKLVTELRDQGRCVAMAGDGFLDAPALSHSDLGIAFESAPLVPADSGAGFDLSAESADLVVRRRSLGSLRESLVLVRRVRKTAHENAMWSFGLQLPLIPVAAGALVPGLGIWFHPAQAAAAGVLGAVAVFLNSRRLLR